MATYGWESGTLPTVAGTVTLDTSVGLPATPSMRVSGTAGASYATFLLAAPADKVSARFYLRTPEAWASASCNILALRSSASATPAQFTMAGTGSPGQARMVRGSGVTLTTSTSGLLSLSTTYRVEMHYDTAATACTIAIYPLNSDTALWSATITDADFATPLDRVLVGRPNSTPTFTSDLWLDSVLIDDTRAEILGRAAGDDLVGDPDPEEPGPITFPITWTGGAVPGVVSGSGVTSEAGGLTDAPLGVLRFAQPSGSVSYTEWNLAGVERAKIAVRAYFCTPSTWASASWGLVTLRPSGATLSTALQVSGAGQPGQIRVVAPDGSTLAQAPNNTIALSSWYRVELQYDSTATRARVAVFPFASTGPLWTSGWIAHAGMTAPIRIIQVGRVNTSPLVGPFGIDELVIDDALPEDWIGRAAGEPGYTMTYWDGTTEHSVTMTYWDGTTEHPVEMEG